MTVRFIASNSDHFESWTIKRTVTDRVYIGLGYFLPTRHSQEDFILRQRGCGLRIDHRKDFPATIRRAICDRRLFGEKPESHTAARTIIDYRTRHDRRTRI